MKRLINFGNGLVGLPALIVLLVLVTLGAQAAAAQLSVNGVVRSSGETISIVVSPETGGELTSPDGLVTIIFPAGMFSEPTRVTYTDMPVVALPDALVRIGPAFTLEAARVSDGEPVVLFEMEGCPGVEGQPTVKSECGSPPEGGTEISVRYADAEVDRAGIAEDAFTLRYFYSPDGVSGKWLSLPTTIDAEQRIVTASTWYFARFALLGLAPRPVRASAPAQVGDIVDDLDSGFARYQAGECADPDINPNLCWWSVSDGHNGHMYYTKNSNDTHGRENWGEWTPGHPRKRQL